MLQIKQIRIEKGLTQQDVANALNISRVAYTNIENRKRDPDTSTLILLADLFGVSLDAMFGRISVSIHKNADRDRLNEIFDSVNAGGQKAIIEYATFIGNKDEYKKISEQSAM